MLRFKVVFDSLLFLKKVSISANFSFIREVTISKNMAMTKTLYHVTVGFMWGRDIVTLDAIKHLT